MTKMFGAHEVIESFLGRLVLDMRFSRRVDGMRLMLEARFSVSIRALLTFRADGLLSRTSTGKIWH